MSLQIFFILGILQLGLLGLVWLGKMTYLGGRICNIHLCDLVAIDIFCSSSLKSRCIRHKVMMMQLIHRLVHVSTSVFLNCFLLAKWLYGLPFGVSTSYRPLLIGIMSSANGFDVDFDWILHILVRITPFHLGNWEEMLIDGLIN